MIKTSLALITVAVMIIAGPGEAQVNRRPQLFGTKIALDCHIVNLKEMIITNMTPSAIAAGTTISFDATRYGNGEHYAGSFTSPALAAGASVHRGTDQSSSCAAWYYKSPFNNLQQNPLRAQ